MNSEDYWKSRTEQREQEWNSKTDIMIKKELAQYYEQALTNIQDDIATLYGRYAKDNKLSIQESIKLLQGKEFRTWRMTMTEYLDQIDKTKDDVLVKELNTLAMRSRISRLDKLYGDTLKELHKMGGKVNKSMENHLANAYKDNYYKNSYDIGQKASLNASFAEVDSAKIKKVLNNPWSGKNYSQRIWKNTDKLSKLIKNEVVNGIHRGISVNKMAKLIQQRMDVGRYEATRLVRTEMNYVQNQAAKDSIKSAGMKYYIFLATLDRRTSSICRAHDRKVYPIDEAQAGTNMPPLHPNCRSTIAGSVKEFDTGRGKRVGRDGEGNRIYVPAAMKYDDFYKIYVEKSQTLAQWEKAYKTKIDTKSIKDDIIKQKDTEKNINSYRLDYIKLVAKNKSFSDREIIIKKVGKEIISKLNISSMQKLSKEFEQVQTNLKYYYLEYNKKPSREAYDNWYKSWEQFKKIENKYYHFCAANVKDTLSVFRPMGINNLDLKTHLKNSKSKKLSILLDAYNVYPTDWIKRSISKSTISIKSVKRGYYDNKNNVIALSGDNGARSFKTAIHELGHRMECVIPTILKQEKAFYERRTANEKLQWIGKGYKKNELTRKDDFIEPYMGKDYSGYAYELVSMGFEMAYTDPIKLLTDEDMAAWIFGMLILL